MENVFDTSGRPPEGWMNAIFDGGPFHDDVGRCVPGPPPPDPLIVGDTTYRVVVIASWSDPDNPIAVYAIKLPVGPNAVTQWWSERTDK